MISIVNFEYFLIWKVVKNGLNHFHNYVNIFNHGNSRIKKEDVISDVF